MAINHTYHGGERGADLLMGFTRQVMRSTMGYRANPAVDNLDSNTCTLVALLTEGLCFLAQPRQGGARLERDWAQGQQSKAQPFVAVVRGPDGLLYFTEPSILHSPKPNAELKIWAGAHVQANVRMLRIVNDLPTEEEVQALLDRFPLTCNGMQAALVVAGMRSAFGAMLPVFRF